MKLPRITLEDIASLADVTKMTVSRYLRTPHKVGKETGARIAAVMAEIGYQRDADNPQVASQTQPRIGVVIPSFHNLIFADLLAGIESVAAPAGWQTLVMNYDYDLQREEEQIATALACHVSALLLTETVHTLRAEKYLSTARVPVAEVMALAATAGRINVGFDNRRAAYEMTQRLIAGGRRQAVWFGSMADLRDEQRYAGYRDAMAAAGLPAGRITPNRISSVSAGYDMMTLARRHYPAMDAIFCTNDDLAVGVLQACVQQGIAVPQQMAIVGFHGLEIGQLTTPKLASVITPRFEMGKIATQLLIRKINKMETEESVELPCILSNGETL